MAYVLLAIGALMALVGIYAAVTGYPIIQVEQGWATVISGATLIAGGAVTGALGLVLRTLIELKAATLRQAGASSAAEAAPPVEPTAAPVPRRAKKAVPVEAAPPPPLAAPDPQIADPVERPMHDSLEPASISAVEPEPQLAPALADTPAELSAPNPPPGPAYEQTPDHDDPAHAPHEAEAAAFASPNADSSPAVPPHAEAPPAEIADPEAVEPPSPLIETNKSAEPSFEEPMPANPKTPAALLQDDWLDRALAEIDRDVLPAPAPPPAPTTPTAAVKRPLVRVGPPLRRQAGSAITPEPDPVLPPVLEPAFAEGPAHDASTKNATIQDAAIQDTAIQDAATRGTPPAPAAAPAAAPTSAVIGRYEADGTSYVMYADGSIEAQSDAGVYRFASMTELKAFIES